jgi:tetratricopeptide (TPR) repeat protein
VAPGAQLPAPGRLLEAAVTFQSALDRFSGDPDYDARNSSSFYDTMRELSRTARGDATIQQMFLRSEELVARYKESAAGDIAFRNAQKAYDEKEFAKALELYRQVPVDAQGYEKALVFIGVCLERQGDLAGAEKAFDGYLNGFLKDPKNQTTDPRKLAARKDAQASARFYWGRVASKLAEAGNGTWEKVIELFEGYEDEFPDQTNFAPAAMFTVIEAFEKAGLRPKVRATFEKMTRLFPASPHTGQAAVKVYAALERDYNAATDPDTKKALLREMAENLEVVNRTSPQPSYVNLKREAGHWMDLGEWQKAEPIYEGVLAKFGAGSDADDVQKFVVPRLGEAYLMLRKPAKAAEVLGPQVDAKKATRAAAQTYARALAGWAHYTPEGTVQVETGLGTLEDLKKATDILQQLEGAVQSWTADWYLFRFDRLYANWVWSKLDSKKLDYVKSELGLMSSDVNLGRQFKHEQMSEPQRQVYLWLAQQVQ